MDKVLKRDVLRAEAAWGDCASRWGDDNQATISALIRYHEVRSQWEQQTGKSYR